MTPLITAILVWAVLIALAEFVMWRIFYARTTRICFLTEPDLPFSRFFTIHAVRLCVLLHTIFLLVTIILFYSILW
jgi:hypothetical protein